MGKNEGLEQFGFVCSFLIFPLGFLYQLSSWYYDGTAAAAANNNNNNTISTTALCIFVAAPLLYGKANRSTSPKLDSIHNLIDDHTRREIAPAAKAENAKKKLEKEHVPEISDCPIEDINRIMEKRLSLQQQKLS